MLPTIKLMTVLTLTNTHGDLAEIDLEAGAAITKLILNKEDIIKYPLKTDDPQKGYPSALLFPFPNRIKDGRYSFGDKDYSLGINDADSSNAIHGLIAFQTFELKEQTKSKATLVYVYEGENEGYPFPFEFSITYALKKGKLDIKVQAENTGETPMPFGFGWHPYFGFSGKAIGEMEVEVPRRFKMELSDRYIPTGEKEEMPAEVIGLKNTILDNVFTLHEPTPLTEITLKCENKKLIVSQESSKNKLVYFVLYTPPTRDCIAIEPQTCNTNAFNSGEGLQVLKPGTRANFQMSVRVEA